ncbi:SGNH/GDSL hydrolase family protein [Devosia sp.]|uniref:SGNH/GDSL hydrolase family protein n=1 Tax=Devosia sp. TaxID=1871048 RepID=UPI003BA92483
MAKRQTILCFGDSNTYGVVPTLARGGGHRYAPDRRWPGVLQRQLGESWNVVEEGHPGRTTVHDDPIDGPHKNGLKALPICLETHMPVDLVIVMLGTNDFKHRFSVTTGDIVDSFEILVNAIRKSDAGPSGAQPAVLLVIPPPIQEIGRLADMFFEGAEKSRRLPPLLAEMAHRNGLPYFDAGEIIEVSAIDGIHLDSDAHRALGLALAKTIQGMLLV